MKGAVWRVISWINAFVLASNGVFAVWVNPCCWATMSKYGAETATPMRLKGVYLPAKADWIVLPMSSIDMLRTDPASDTDWNIRTASCAASSPPTPVVCLT